MILWDDRIGCPAGCPLDRHDCGLSEPILVDLSLYDCIVEFVPDRDQGVRLTCSQLCRGYCPRRKAR